MTELEYEKQLGLKDMEIKGKEVRIAELEESNKEWQRTCEAKSDTNSQLTEQLAEKVEKIADLEDKLANADYQLEGRDNEIKELTEKIEKMKCCGNCSHFKLDNSGLYPIKACELTYPNRCKNSDKWELRR